ncbi:MAG: HEAT repeat domain-containing protein [Phycisphaerae bacterium]|nr:HEAT repeat domain-containing protein [Phycisphaerales bacterium]
MQDPRHNPMHAPTPAKESWRRPIEIIVLMVIAFAIVVIFRNEIRVRWWGYRLAQTSDVQDRMQYLSLLSSMDVKSLPVARTLIKDTDPANRSFGVALLSTINGDEADRLLEVACIDNDKTIRQSAILGLSMRATANTVYRLAGLIKQLDADSAMFAVSRLAGINRPESLAELTRIARSHPEAGVRAQAIESLGQWGGDDVVGPLIDCLSDDAVYSGLTATEAQAHDALASMAPQFAVSDKPGSDSSKSENTGAAKDTNGMRAARKLRDITGQSFGYLDADAAERTLAIARWRSWFESKSGE